MSNVIRMVDFKGRQKLKEHFAGFIYCPKCFGLLHWEGSPCLDAKDLHEAISFNRYVKGSHVYYSGERAMIEHAKYEGIVE